MASPLISTEVKKSWISEETKQSLVTFGKKAGAVVVFATILPAVAKAINIFATSWEKKTNFAEGTTFSKANGFKGNFGIALRKIGQVAARLFGLSTALEFLSRMPAKAFDWAAQQFNTKVVRKEPEAHRPLEGSGRIDEDVNNDFAVSSSLSPRSEYKGGRSIELGAPVNGYESGDE